ncbi:MAG: DNA-binding protein [Methanotrichaceae archaeon]|nr:DNA-binding protein [Methanotrichaceae archaeon]
MKRSREEIAEQILEICREPASKTRIVYQANLNFNTVMPHLDMLIMAGLLEILDAQIVTYKTTEKGIKALEHIKAFRDLIRPAGQLG